jgi:hypothetical protein
MKKNVRASATVELTVVLSNLGCWGDDCKLDQVHRQAADAALTRLEQAKYKVGLHHRIVGTPKVTVIVVEEE